MREELEICVKEFFEEVKEIEEKEQQTSKSQMGDFMEEAKEVLRDFLEVDVEECKSQENKEIFNEKNVNKEEFEKFTENLTNKVKENIAYSEIAQEEIFEYDRVFNYAHAHVAKVEGKLSDHKNDPGGITKYGISLAFLEDYSKTANGRKVLTKLKIYNVGRESIIKMTSEQSKNIMYNAFWLSTKIANLPPLLAIIAYDFAVNSGSYYSCRLIQRAIGAKVDGIIGNETITKANNLSQLEQKKVAKFMLEERVRFYQNLAKSKPKFSVFLKGWLSRVEILRQYLNEISKDLFLVGSSL